MARPVLNEPRLSPKDKSSELTIKEFRIAAASMHGMSVSMAFGDGNTTIICNYVNFEANDPLSWFMIPFLCRFSQPPFASAGCSVLPVINQNLRKRALETPHFSQTVVFRTVGLLYLWILVALTVSESWGDPKWDNKLGPNRPRLSPQKPLCLFGMDLFIISE